MASNNDPHDPEFALPSSSTILNTDQHQKPRRKRTKTLVEIERYLIPSTATAAAAKKPKYSEKKAELSAPIITRPCSECGKEFRSWKALFGHMRCHPERQWRGINPPPNYRRSVSPIHHQFSTTTATNMETLMTEEDHDVASCLLMLANSNTATTLDSNEFGDGDGTGVDGNHNSSFQVQDDEMNCRFGRSSCMKVFGSRQALGGHRASHKNVKGSSTITNIDDCEVIEDHGGSGDHVKENVSDSKLVMELGHKCSICSRVFPSGQALGGHKRCHWEKGEETSISSSMNQGLQFLAAKEGCRLDLNLPAPIEGEPSSTYSSSLTLGLSLGL